MSDHRPENHATTCRLLFASSLKNAGLLGESVLHVDVPLFENADAVAGDHHVLRWIHIDLDHDGSVDLALDAWRRVFAAHAAGLIEHVGRDTAKVRADENLKGGRFVVADQANDRESISRAILHRSSRAFRLVASSVLLLRLADNLQLHLPIRGGATCKLYEETALKCTYSKLGIWRARISRIKALAIFLWHSYRDIETVTGVEKNAYQ